FNDVPHRGRIPGLADPDAVERADDLESHELPRRCRDPLVAHYLALEGNGHGLTTGCDDDVLLVNGSHSKRPGYTVQRRGEFHCRSVLERAVDKSVVLVIEFGGSIVALHPITHSGRT